MNENLTEKLERNMRKSWGIQLAQLKIRSLKSHNHNTWETKNEIKFFKFAYWVVASIILLVGCCHAFQEDLFEYKTEL